eukprot:727405-Ditylum_brightwellii.AAC.1
MPLGIIEDETTDIGTKIAKDKTSNISNITTEGDKHIMEDNEPTEESKEEQPSCTLQESRSYNIDDTHNTTCDKLCVWLAYVEKKLATGKGKKYFAMVDIVDVLCNDVEHSKLQSIVNDKVVNYSVYHLFYTWQFSQRTKERITKKYDIFLMKVIMLI